MGLGRIRIIRVRRNTSLSIFEITKTNIITSLEPIYISSPNLKLPARAQYHISDELMQRSESLRRKYDTECEPLWRHHRLHTNKLLPLWNLLVYLFLG